MDKNKRISLRSLILILIATDFGFSNIITGYNQMGYAGIIWYVVSAIVFLFPLAMIFAEYSGSFERDHGGFYTWLINSVGEKWAFIGTFIWVGMGLISLLQMTSGLGINISGLIYGKDISQSWKLGPFDSNELEAFIGIALIILLTFFATKGFRKVSVTGTIGGILSLSVIAIFVVSSIIIFIGNHCHFAQPIHGVSSFFKSPNAQFQSPLSVGSFAVYAMFAYAGLEMCCGFIDKLRDPQRDYPRAMMWVSGILATLYSLGLLICGAGTNWKQVLGQPGVDLNNNGFAVFNHLGIGVAKTLGLSASTGVSLGKNLVRLLAIGSVVPLIGLLLVSIYSPIKGLIAGSSKDLWPKKIAHFNKHDMPACAMWIECIILVLMLLFVAMTGKNGQQFYQIIVDMGNVGAIFPYFFIVIAFVYFKKRHDVAHPIVFFHSMKSTYIATTVLFVAMAATVAFNLIVPILRHQPMTSFWTIAGPALFWILAAILYHMAIYHRKHNVNHNSEE